MLQIDNTNKLSTEQMMDAISNGVRQAIWDVMTNNTDMPCADFYDAIKNGVTAAHENIAMDS